jgi:hypothetical protein
MKIIELQEIFDPTTSEYNYKGKFKPSSYPEEPHPIELGRGSFSVAQLDKSDPHMIKKHQFIGPTQLTDVFQDYANIIIEEKLWDMVHFPRIYKIKKFTDSTEKTLYKWHMEKLSKLSTLNDKEITYLYEKYFNILSEYRKDFDLAETIEDAVKHNPKIITDQILFNAVKKLIKIHNILFQEKYPQLFYDLHVGNIMVRRNPTSLDIVFTDPFASR